MKKMILILLLPIAIVACGKGTPAPINNLGLFALPSGIVDNDDRFEIIGLWESDRINQSGSDYIILRASIRNDKVVSSINCFFDGENIYATSESPAEETSPGVVQILENNEKTETSNSGRKCIAYTSKGQISNTRIRPDGSFGDGSVTFRKINN